MYFTAYEALEPRDLKILESILTETRHERRIASGNPSLEALAKDLVNLWHAGFRSQEELKAMLKPLDDLNQGHVSEA